MEDTRTKTVITFVPTWKCQLACSYCDYKVLQEGDKEYEVQMFHQKWKFGRELTWPEWLVYLNRFRPYHLELTGGEPLAYKGLADFMAHLPQDSTWAMTSNTLGEVRLMEPGNCKFWTASYHYHTTDKFLKNVLWLRNRGFPIRVTLVMSMKTKGKLFEAIDLLKKNEIMVNIHPILKEGFSWSRTQERQDLMAKVKGMADGVWVNFVDDVPKQWAPKKFANCNSGGKYFALMPDGTVLRCYSAILWHGVVGHIGTYQPRQLFSPCNQACVFHCDNRAQKAA